MAIEDELVSCENCSGLGTVGGNRCPKCLGRGITRVPHAIVVVDEDADEAPDGEEPAGLDELEALTVATLRERAGAVGVSTKGAKSVLISRIRAAQEAAQAPIPVAGDEAPDGEEPAGLE